MGKLKCRLDASPTKIRIGNSLANRLLKIAYAFCFNPLAVRFSFFALDPESVLFGDVVLLRFAVDGRDHGRWQLDTVQQSIVDSDRLSHGDAVRDRSLSLHHLVAHRTHGRFPDPLLNLIASR